MVRYISNPAYILLYSYLIYTQGNAVSNLQTAIDRPQMENVTSSNLRILHCELHPLQRNEEKEGATDG